MFDDVFQQFLEALGESLITMAICLDVISILVFCGSALAYLFHRSRKAALWLLPAALWAAYHGLCLGLTIPDMLSPVVKAGSHWGDDFIEIVHMGAFLALAFAAMSPLFKRLLVAKRGHMQCGGPSCRRPA